VETGRSLKIESWPEMFLAKKIKRVLTEEISDFKFCFVRRRKRYDVDHGVNK
jgi:hypothetical protein